MHEQNEKIHREIEIIIQNQAEILKLNNTMKEMKKCNRIYHQQN
jgi:hypothetical protein